MLVGEFVRGTAGWLNLTARTGEPLHVENGRNSNGKHVTVVPTTLWEQAEAALLRERASNERHRHVELDREARIA